MKMTGFGTGTTSISVEGKEHPIDDKGLAEVDIHDVQAVAKAFPKAVVVVFEDEDTETPEQKAERERLEAEAAAMAANTTNGKNKKKGK